MITFLFWNLCKQPIQDSIALLALWHEIDVIILAECSIEPSVLLKQLNQMTASHYVYEQRLNCEKIEMFTRFPTGSLPIVLEDNRLIARRLKVSNLQQPIYS